VRWWQNLGTLVPLPHYKPIQGSALVIYPSWDTLGSYPLLNHAGKEENSDAAEDGHHRPH